MLPTAGATRPSRLEDLLDGRLMARIERLDLRSQRVFSGKLQGERRSKRRGRSVEFDDYRLYTPGDDLRFIDWNVYARFDRLFIKLFLEEEDLALHVAIDASASMDTGEPNKRLFAAKVAMALAALGLTQNNRVGVTIFGLPLSQSASGMLRLPDLRGRRNLQRVSRFVLDALWPAERPSNDRLSPATFSDSLSTIARLRVGKGVMVILSDFFAPPVDASSGGGGGGGEQGYERGLRALAAAGGYDTFCMQTLSPGELEPESESSRGLTGDLRLTDIETGAAAEVTLTPALIRAYKKRLEAFCAGLHEFCLAREMTHLLVRTDAELESFMLDTLRRQGVIG